MKVFIIVLALAVIVTAKRGDDGSGNEFDDEDDYPKAPRAPEKFDKSGRCVAKASCVAPETYDGCQCECPAIRCNSFQTLNKRTCACQCLYSLGAPLVRSFGGQFYSQSPCFAPLVWNQAQCNCAAAAV